MENREVWADIPGYKGKYQVSNLGQIRSRDRQGRYKLMRTSVDSDGFMRISLYVPDSGYKVRNHAVHRLVAESFIPNPNKYSFVLHKNDNRRDNRAENLEWVKSKKGNLTVTTEEKRMKLLVKCSSMPCTTKCPLHEAGIKCGEGTSFMKRDGDKYDMPDKVIELAYKMMFEGYKPKTAKALVTKAQAKQSVEIHACPYGSGLQCDSPDTKCVTCGWNPAVAKKRLVAVNKPGGLTKNALGLFRLKLKQKV